MIIDIENNTIKIEVDSDFNVIHKSQLAFWEFSLLGDIYYAPFNQNLYLKIINYFKQTDINVELGINAEEYSKRIESTALSFEKLKTEAYDFKRGEIDFLKFDDFREFAAANIYRSLKIHQLKAAFHLYLVGNGANFSVPGSGKTSVILTVYEKLRQEGKVNTLFVVGPPSCFGPWRNEFKETLGREPDYKILAGGNTEKRKDEYHLAFSGKSEFYLTTFHSILADHNEVDYFLKSKRIKCFFVVDEAHYMKQLNGSWAQALLKLSKNTDYRCILTGTPMPRSYTDIFNLFDFLWPSQNPISHNDKVAIKYHEEKETFPRAKKILSDSIGALYYRVRKSDLNLQPQNFIAPLIIKMNPLERKIYDAIFDRIKSYSREEYFQNIEFISKLGRGRIMRLRQAISYPKLLESAIDEVEKSIIENNDDIKSIIKNYDNLETPAKIIELVKIVKKLQKKKLKVVIWSNFISSIKLIEKSLQSEGYYCKIIYGDVPVEGRAISSEETRESIRDEFVNNNSGLDILIANPAACAESISLHKTCFNAIYYDLNYNCAQYLQSLDRIHRVGGSEFNTANYYYLQYENTIDSDIKNNLDNKTKKMLDIIEEDFTIYSLDMFVDDGGDFEAYRRIFLDNNA